MNSDLSKDSFLRSFVETGRINRAAALSGVAMSSHYQWVRNDPAYKLAFEDAKAQFAEEMEQEVRRRGFEGFKEVRVERRKNEEGDWEEIAESSVSKYSDALALAWLKANSEKYVDRSKQEITGKDGAPLGNTGLEHCTADELALIKETILKARERADTNDNPS